MKYLESLYFTPYSEILAANFLTFELLVLEQSLRKQSYRKYPYLGGLFLYFKPLSLKLRSLEAVKCDFGYAGVSYLEYGLLGVRTPNSFIFDPILTTYI